MKCESKVIVIAVGPEANATGADFNLASAPLIRE